MMNTRFMTRTSPLPFLQLLQSRRMSFFEKPIVKKQMLTGVWPIVATPFNSHDESLNFEAFGKIVKFWSDEIKVDGMTITGVLGESNRLTDEERLELIKIACQSSNVPICVGTSHAGTRATVDLSKMAIENGAHSVMITPSREGVPNEKKIIEYYQRIGKELGDTPIVLQDHPASTQVNMSIPTILEIIDTVPSVRCVKLESLPSPARMRIVKSHLRKNEKEEHVSLLTGLGGLYGYFDIQAGSNGFMTGFAFPEALQSIYEAEMKGIVNKV